MDSYCGALGEFMAASSLRKGKNVLTIVFSSVRQVSHLTPDFGTWKTFNSFQSNQSYNTLKLEKSVQHKNGEMIFKGKLRWEIARPFTSMQNIICTHSGALNCHCAILPFSFAHFLLCSWEIFYSLVSLATFLTYLE